MSVEENKALMRRWVEEINKGKAAALAVMDEIFATNIVVHTSGGRDIHDIENWNQAMGNFFDAYLDIHITIDDMVAEGDKVTARWTRTGTHKDTNKKETGWGIGIHRVVGGKVVERWARYRSE